MGLPMKKAHIVDSSFGKSHSFSGNYKYNKALNDLIDESWKEAIRGFAFSQESAANATSDCGEPSGKPAERK